MLQEAGRQAGGLREGRLPGWDGQVWAPRMLQRQDRSIADQRSRATDSARDVGRCGDPGVAHRVGFNTCNSAMGTEGKEVMHVIVSCWYLNCSYCITASRGGLRYLPSLLAWGNSFFLLNRQHPQNFRRDGSTLAFLVCAYPLPQKPKIQLHRNTQGALIRRYLPRYLECNCGAAMERFSACKHYSLSALSHTAKASTRPGEQSNQVGYDLDLDPDKWTTHTGQARPTAARLRALALPRPALWERLGSVVVVIYRLIRSALQHQVKKRLPDLPK